MTNRPMDNKTPEMREAIESMFPGTMDAISKNRCPLCKQSISAFRNKISEKEYLISGMCQTCQDKMFGVDNKDPDT